ncbi:MAG: DUF488 family protein [Candidatus Shapirobacteria bacterium]|nr:DUF488 family protein [Candidatus Shapirobacteria bacterium]
MIRVKRVYTEEKKEDGFRILVDRLWPRGVSKEKADIDLWIKELAPSTELRRWFGHDVEKWNEFREKYKKELIDKKEFLDQIKNIEKNYGTVTLVYASEDEKYNLAVVLKRILSDNY